MPFAISILIGYKTKFMAGVYIVLGKYFELMLYHRFFIGGYATQHIAPSTPHRWKNPHHSQGPIISQRCKYMVFMVNVHVKVGGLKPNQSFPSK